VGIVNLLEASPLRHTRGMNTPAASKRSKNHRFPVESISHGVWLYFRFCLSYRDVEELLFVRGVVVTYEAIRQWCRKFGQQYANQLRRRRPQPGDTWHLDEVFLTIKASATISGGRWSPKTGHRCSELSYRSAPPFMPPAAGKCADSPAPSESR
jgi:hypothetical protein